MTTRRRATIALLLPLLGATPVAGQETRDSVPPEPGDTPRTAPRVRAPRDTASRDTAPLEPGDRLRVEYVRASAASEHGEETIVLRRELRFWRLEPDGRFLFATPGGERVYVEPDRLVGIHRWRAHPSAGRTGRILGAVLGVAYGAQVWRFENSFGEEPGRLTLGAALLGFGLGVALGNALEGDFGKWQAVPIDGGIGRAGARGSY